MPFREGCPVESVSRCFWITIRGFTRSKNWPRVTASAARRSMFGSAAARAGPKTGSRNSRAHPPSSRRSSRCARNFRASEQRRSQRSLRANARRRHGPPPRRLAVSSNAKGWSHRALPAAVRFFKAILRNAPNKEWSIDFKGWFRTANVTRADDRGLGKPLFDRDADHEPGLRGREAHDGRVSRKTAFPMRSAPATVRPSDLSVPPAFRACLCGG